MKIFFKTIVIAGMIGMTLPARAQVSAVFDTSRMQRDLDIMTAVLDRLVFHAPQPFVRFGGHETKGIYLPDYGVLFLRPTHSAVSVFSFTTDARREIEVAQQMQQLDKTKLEARRAQGYAYRTENTTQNIKKPLLEFFSKYADAIGQLDDSERIVVYTASGNRQFYSQGVNWHLSAQSTNEPEAQDLLAVARKADIVALRSGKIKTDDFNNRVVFKNIEVESASSDIDILAGIIDKAFQTRKRTSEPVLQTNNSHGVYLDDFGVIFFTNAAYAHENASVYLLQDLERHVGTTQAREKTEQESLERRLFSLQKASEQRRENWMIGYKKFKQQLGDIIADYGHTLRQLQPDDNIIITANLDNSAAPETGPDYLVCRVKKQHVDAFNARRMSREQFMKQISYMEY